MRPSPILLTPFFPRQSPAEVHRMVVGRTRAGKSLVPAMQMGALVAMAPSKALTRTAARQGKAGGVR